MIQRSRRRYLFARGPLAKEVVTHIAGRHDHAAYSSSALSPLPFGMLACKI